MRNLLTHTVLASALLLVPLLVFGAEGQGYDFIPLTNLPGINEAAESSTLPAFLNSLYKLCIGAAAVIAIIQIMRAGMYFMFNKGSVAHNEQAKSLISNSIFGLLLVLSPAIIFGIINPDILSLRLDVRSLQPGELGLDPSATIAMVVRNTTPGQQTISDANTVSAEDQQRLRQYSQACQRVQGTVQVTPATQTIACPQGVSGTCHNATVRCQIAAGSANVGPTSTITGSSGTQSQPTEQVQNQQYAVRVRALNNVNGFAKLYSGVFPNKQQCDAYFASSVAEMQRNNWVIDSNFQGCDCSQPQSAWPGCRN
jgi:hypothetical protein